MKDKLPKLKFTKYAKFSIVKYIIYNIIQISL